MRKTGLAYRKQKQGTFYINIVKNGEYYKMAKKEENKQRGRNQGGNDTKEPE